MPLFKKKILNPRTYVMDGQTVDLPSDRFRKWVRNFRKLRDEGYKLPAPFYHDEKAVPLRLKPNEKDTNAFNNGGFWNRLWVSKKDGALWGEIEVNDPEKAAKITNNEIAEVSPAIRNEFDTDTGKKYQDVLTHIAMVTQPVAGGQEPFKLAASHQFFARSMQEHPDEGGDNWDFALVQNPTAPPPGTIASTGPVTAANATLDDVLKVLETRGLVLPKDTTESNFYERVVTAALAVEGGGQGTMKPQQLPPHTHILSREEPTMAEDKNELNEELQVKYDAALNFARDTAVKSIKDRIQALIDSKRCSEELIKEKVLPLAEKHEIQFSKEGKIVPGALDITLDILESLPVPEPPKKEEPNPFMPRMVDMSRGQVEEQQDDDAPKLPESPDEIDQLINRIPALKARVVG